MVTAPTRRTIGRGRFIDKAALRWRSGLFACFLLGLLSLVVVVWMNISIGASWRGDYTTNPAGPYLTRVVDAAPGSELNRGDLIDLAALSPGDRYRFINNDPVAAERIRLPVRRGDRHLSVQLIGRLSIARFASQSFWAKAPIIAFIAGQLWMLLFAAVIAWRRPDSIVGRILCVLLILKVVSSDLAQRNWVTPWLPIDLAASVLSVLLAPVGTALFATYAACFGGPLSPVRRVVTWCSYASAAVAAVLGLAVLAVTLWPAGNIGELVLSGPVAFIIGGLPFIFPLLCAIAAIGTTRGSERTAISWATASLGPFYSVAIAFRIAILLKSPSAQLLLDLINISLFVAPAGLTYSLLGRRLLDIGFALNRATIFAGVSLLVFATFSLIEWGLGGWLSTMNRTTNLIVSALLALALGLSLRPIHGRVERVVDRVLFRKRHDDEQALRAFAHEAAYFTDSDILIRETQRVIETRADVSGVTLALDTGGGAYGIVAENDPGIVALRAWRKPIDLHTLESAMQGEYAYPMVARGRLVGALIVGSKQNGDSYAPDESEAIARIAHSVGNALDLLEVRRDASNDRFSAAIEKLTDGMERLSARLDRLAIDRSAEFTA